MKAMIGNSVGSVFAAAVVTAAYYAWRLPQRWGALAVLVAYAISALLLLVGAFVALRHFVRRDYQRHHRLTPFSTALESAVAGLYIAFPTIYSPPNWAWFWLDRQQAGPVRQDVGSLLIVLGLATIVLAMAWLGLRRSSGQEVSRLQVSGPYGLSRNPQILGGALLIVGVFLLRPSWYALGWVLLCATMLHLMVLAEEEHLRARFGGEFEHYVARVPRYLGIPKRGEPQ